MTAETKSAGPACCKEIDKGSGDRGITEHMAELHSTFHPLTRIRCATPACNRGMNSALLLFNLMPELGISKLQFSFLHKILKHHNNQSLELQFHSLPFSCTEKKPPKPNIRLICTYSVLTRCFLLL